MKEHCLRGEGDGWGAYSCYIYISIDTGQRVMFVDKLLETCVKLARIRSGWSMLVGTYGFNHVQCHDDRFHGRN